MRRKKKILKLMALLLVAMSIIASGMNSVTASAATPYLTYTVDGYGRMEETQTGYLAQDTIIKFGKEFMGGANDSPLPDRRDRRRKDLYR